MLALDSLIPGQTKSFGSRVDWIVVPNKPLYHFFTRSSVFNCRVPANDSKLGKGANIFYRVKFPKDDEKVAFFSVGDKGQLRLEREAVAYDVPPGATVLPLQCEPANEESEANLKSRLSKDIVDRLKAIPEFYKAHVRQPAGGPGLRDDKTEERKQAQLAISKNVVSALGTCKETHPNEVATAEENAGLKFEPRYFNGGNREYSRKGWWRVE